MSIYLNVNDLQRSRAFYEALGLEKRLEFPEMGVVGYGLGGATLVLGDASTGADAQARAWLGSGAWGVGAVVVPEVDDVDAVHARAVAKGLRVVEPPADKAWGSRTMTLVDPDGYLVMVEQVLRPPAAAKRTARKTAKKAPAKRAAPKAAKKPAKRASKGTRPKAARKGGRR